MIGEVAQAMSTAAVSGTTVAWLSVISVTMTYRRRTHSDAASEKNDAPPPSSGRHLDRSQLTRRKKRFHTVYLGRIKRRSKA
jgi:hypothetical protein